MKVYIIAGKAGSGKNTTANYIKNYYESLNKKVVITEISKYLKIFAYEVLNWDGQRETKPRAFLQQIGDFVRHEEFNEDFFINRFLEDLKIYEKFVDVVIVADARLPREIDLIKDKCHGISIEIINKFNDYELKGTEKLHETETALDSYNNFDYVIYNQTLDKLNTDTINIIKEVEENEK